MVFSRIYLQQWGLKQLQAVDINKYSSSSRQHISNKGIHDSVSTDDDPMANVIHTHTLFTHIMLDARDRVGLVSHL